MGLGPMTQLECGLGQPELPAGRPGLQDPLRSSPARLSVNPGRQWCGPFPVTMKHDVERVIGSLLASHHPFTRTHACLVMFLFNVDLKTDHFIVIDPLQSALMQVSF